MIKCILWDLDGVLIDMPEFHFKALNMSIKELVGFEISNDEHEKYYNGISTDRKLHILEQRGIIKEEQKKPIWLLKQKYTEEFIDTFKEDKIKIDMVKKFKSDGYILGCVSNSIISSTKKMLKTLGIQSYMDLVLGNEDFGEKIKPDPHPYLLAMSLLFMEPENCLILEDSEKGLLSAYASKAYVMEINSVDEVNYDNIIKRIGDIK